MAIIDSTTGNKNNVILMKKDGSIIKKISQNNDLLKNNELPKYYQSGTVYLNFASNSFKLDWDTRYIWFYNVMGPAYLGLVKIDSQTSNIKKYNLSKLPIGSELAFNLFTEKLAYSTYPAMFDVESQAAFDKSSTQVKLDVYDLNKKAIRHIGISIAKKFTPKWIDKHTLDFATGAGDGSRMHLVIW